MHPILKSLCAEPEISSLDEDAIEGFVNDKETPLRVLFLAGDPDKKPESADVAVVLRELVRGWSGKLAVGIPTPEAERAAIKLCKVGILPSLVVFAACEKLETLPRIMNWSDYAEAMPRLLTKAAKHNAREEELA